jgi:hypothetical protein
MSMEAEKSHGLCLQTEDEGEPVVWIQSKSEGPTIRWAHSASSSLKAGQS